jgi:hypothetical protein
VAAMQLSRTHRILVGVVITGAVVIAGIGFAGSYAAVRALAESKGFGEFALVFPVGIDAGICVLLALDLLLTWIRIPFPLLRQAAWVLTAATIAFNGAAAWPDPLGVGMHAVIPLLFIVTVEAARHAVGRIADITADKHMEGVRLTRWLLSPVPTFLLWRRMKLWELRSYEQVIKLEQDRLIYQSRLQARFGRGWRRKAPVESLMPLRLAKYGVPLADTASAGLAAAGIDTVAAIAPATGGAPARELTAAAEASGTPTEGSVGLPTGAGTASGEAGPAERAPGASQQGSGPQQWPDELTGQQRAGVRARLQRQGPQAQGLRGQGLQQGQAQGPRQPDGIRPPAHPADPGHPAYAEAMTADQAQLQQEWEQQQWAEQQAWAEQQGYPEQPEADVSPWFAAPGIPEGAYEGAYNPTYVEGLEPTPVMPPAGPGGRGRPLGAGPGVPVPEQRQPDGGEGGQDRHDGQWQGPDESRGSGPGQGPDQVRLREQWTGQQHLSEGELATEAEAGAGAGPDAAPASATSDDLPREEAYYNALRKYISEYNDMPNERQFGRYLLEMYDFRGRTGGPLSESTLRAPLREAQRRFQEDLDSEHIA